MKPETPRAGGPVCCLWAFAPAPTLPGLCPWAVLPFPMSANGSSLGPPTPASSRSLSALQHHSCPLCRLVKQQPSRWCQEPTREQPEPRQLHPPRAPRAHVPGRLDQAPMRTHTWIVSHSNQFLTVTFATVFLETSVPLG